MRTSAVAASLLAIAFAALVLWLRHYALPRVDQHRPRIVASIEQATGMGASVSGIRGRWEGLRPSLTLQDFRLTDRQGKAALAFERAELTLSWWALALGEVRFKDVDFYRPELTLRRGADGLIYLADKALNAESPDDDGAFTRWLLAQPRLGIHEAALTWSDERVGSEVRLENVEIAVERAQGRHRAALTAAPPLGLARRLDLRVDARIRRDGPRWRAEGDFYGEAMHANLAALRAHLPLPESLRGGVGSARLWARFGGDRLSEVVADLSMRDARLQLDEEAPPLELAALAGRATYRALKGGFRVATEGLRLKLASGAESLPGNFTLQREAAPADLVRTEVAADAVDLTLAAALLENLPVPRELKAQVHRFAPRGRVTSARVAWTGDASRPATAYSLEGRFENVGVNAVAGTPGVSGLSGQVTGTELGGELRLDSHSAQLEIGRFFREPLRFDRLQARATWQLGERPLEVTVHEARFANPDAEGQLAGTWRALPGAKPASPGFADFRGTLSRASAPAVARYIPNNVPEARDWLQSAIVAGRSPRAAFELRGDLYGFPFGPGHPGHFLIEGDLEGGELRYHPEWPSVRDVHGTFRFQNTRMEIRADRAGIFASRASAVSAVIENLSADPPLLVVQGTIGTTGADSMRFLRESPLVNGPGAFTRAVAVEGPGRLRLRLDYPLWGEQPVKVDGEYAFDGAVATVGPRLAMRDVKGRLAFTERGVTAPEITGTLFGKPATLSMATQSEGTVVTTLDGRADAAALREFVAPPIAERISGETRWKARVTSTAQAVNLTLTSDLQGLAVKLPAPLAKAATDERQLMVAIARLGTDSELTTATLGGGIFGRFGRIPGTPRWHAALRFGSPLANEPVREGLYLYGSMPQLDVDAWQSVFATPRGAAAAAAPASAADDPITLRGLDLALDRVHYFGRDFARMRARLERSGAQWNGQLESPLVVGTVQWSPAGRGRLTARFARLAIEPPTSSGPEGETSTDEGGDLPELDVVADRFEFKGLWMGRLELAARPAGNDWRIERLDITNDHARFTSRGDWRRTGTGSLTALDLKLESENLNALLGQFGYGDYVRRGNGTLEGKLVWPGYPYDFTTGALSGSFKLEARRGQFSKIEPGAGKLLALLSLQSLPRRAAFDFRDVFSEGFAFERMEGDVKLAKGVLLTEGFEISGPSAFVSLTGEVSLPQETQSLNMRVVPEVGETMALAATVLGTPVLGLSTLLVSKLLRNPLGKVVAYEYQVTGSWDNPQVTRTSAPPARAAAAPDTPAAAPRATTPP